MLLGEQHLWAQDQRTRARNREIERSHDVVAEIYFDARTGKVRTMSPEEGKVYVTGLAMGSLGLFPHYDEEILNE